MSERFPSAVEGLFAPAAALVALEGLAESSGEARAELGACPAEFLAELADLLVVSPPMLDALRSHPAWIGWLLERSLGSGTADEPRPWRQLDEARAFKRRALLEIALRDVSGRSPFAETVARLSELADLLVAGCLEHCWEGLADERPGPELDRARSAGFAVFALGKLGGRELNYSSDIDLVFLRGEGSAARSSGAESEAELRLFTRLGERLIQSLSQAGADGALYRVDMRLRPYGESGPLVPTLPSVVDYYESWSEAWERQALIKARFVAGAPDLGRRFTDFVRRFTFARQMDDSSLEELKQVKFRAEREYALPGHRFHVKQGPGGIRDIEFYVQYLQLVGGGDHPDLRSGATLEALDRLARARMLLDGEESELALAYLFLRTVEHRLQLRALTPAAVLPEGPGELDWLARSLGFAEEDAAGRLRRALDRYCLRVRAILERVYLTPGYLHLREREEELAQLLTERTPRERVREILSHYGFRDLDQAWRNIRLLALGPAGRILPPAERRAFLGIAFTLLEVLRDALDPDQALHHLESFASASGNRVSFLRSVASRRSHLARLADLVALSNQAHQILVRHPEYFDTLARGIFIHEGRTTAGMEAELADRFDHAPAGASAPDLLRRFRQRELLRIAYRDVSGLAAPLEVSAELSALAEACLRAVLPRVSASAGDGAPPLVVLALGKLGSRQMHYSSDLDLIFLYRDPEAGDAEERARSARARDAEVEQILQWLGGVTAEGIAYRVDLRLRPEGASGLLARSWASFLEYADLYMQPWERMALVRSRLLAPAEAAARWRDTLDRLVYGFAWDAAAVESIRHLKHRIEAEKSRETRTHLDFKYGRGGIADLEFLVQLLQVLHGEAGDGVRAPGVEDALEGLEAAGALEPLEAEALGAAHRFQRHVENHFQLLDEWMAREVSRESPQLVRLARSLGWRAHEPGDAKRAFLAEWDRHARAVRGLVEKYFYDAGRAP